MEGDRVILVFDVVKSRFVYICLSVSASCGIDYEKGLHIKISVRVCDFGSAKTA